MPYIIEQGEDDEFIYVVPKDDQLSDNYVTIGTDIPLARRLQLAQDIALLLEHKLVVAYRLNLEMGYADYSPDDQSTPSMLESCVYATQELAQQAQLATRAWIKERYPDHANHWALYPDIAPILHYLHDVCDTPEVPKDQIAMMMMHYLGEDALDDEEDPE